MGLINMHLIFLTSFLLLPKLFSMTIVSAAMWWYLEQGGKGRLAMATTPARRSITLPPEYRHTSAWLRTSCSCSERDAILHTHTVDACRLLKTTTNKSDDTHAQYLRSVYSTSTRNKNSFALIFLHRLAFLLCLKWTFFWMLFSGSWHKVLYLKCCCATTPTSDHLIFLSVPKKSFFHRWFSLANLNILLCCCCSYHLWFLDIWLLKRQTCSATVLQAVFRVWLWHWRLFQSLQSDFVPDHFQFRII